MAQVKRTITIKGRKHWRSQHDIAAQIKRLGADSLLPPEKPTKYRAHKTVVDGITFASAAEARRYGELKLLFRAGEIGSLAVHPEYPITVNGKRICKYVADFAYYERGGRRVIEDVKGIRTPVYRLKKKLVEAVHGITITEVQA